MTNKTFSRYWLLIIPLLLFVCIVAGYLGQSNAPVTAQTKKTPTPKTGGSPTIALKPKHPTNKIVCSCFCDGSVETFDEPIGGCSTLTGTACGKNEDKNLTSCKKKSVINELKALSGLDAIDGVVVDQ